jgi:hypothetical protein
MKFQNKIFYKFIFPQEFPYALWAIGEFGRGKLCTNAIQIKNPMTYS